METTSEPSAAPLPPPPQPVPARKPGLSIGRLVLILVGVFVLGCGIAAATTVWWVKRNIYASPIQPVHLTAKEQESLEAKLHVLETSAAPAAQPAASPGEQERTLVITPKEINAYLASRDLGDRIQVQLAQDTISATVLLPVPPDSGLPLVSGTTIRVGLTLNARMDDAKKVAVEVRDVRVGGLPMPNAWLGNVKGLNLAGENLENDPAMKQFFSGIQSLKIGPEGLRVVLAE